MKKLLAAFGLSFVIAVAAIPSIAQNLPLRSSAEMAAVSAGYNPKLADKFQGIYEAKDGDLISLFWERNGQIGGEYAIKGQISSVPGVMVPLRVEGSIENGLPRSISVSQVGIPVTMRAIAVFFVQFNNNGNLLLINDSDGFRKEFRKVGPIMNLSEYLGRQRIVNQEAYEKGQQQVRDILHLPKSAEVEAEEKRRAAFQEEIKAAKEKWDAEVKQKAEEQLKQEAEKPAKVEEQQKQEAAAKAEVDQQQQKQWADYKAQGEKQAAEMQQKQQQQQKKAAARGMLGGLGAVIVR